MNLADATQSVKLLFFFFVVLLIDRSNERWSRYKYLYRKGCLRAFLNPFIAKCGSGKEACARSSIMIEIYKTESGVHTAL